MQQTMMLVKPDAVERVLVGEILSQIEAGGLRIRRMRMIQLRPEEARRFYRIHEGKPFLGDLVTFMSRSPIVACVLEGERAVSTLRGIMGATDPSRAEAGTIRARFGRSIQENSVHGSDSRESATTEIAFFDLGLALSG